MPCVCADPEFKVGDVFEVTLSFAEGIGALSFSRNGVHQGVAHAGIDAKQGPYFPAVSMDYANMMWQFLNDEQYAECVQRHLDNPR